MLPSRFVAELPAEHLEVIADRGLYPRAAAPGEDWSGTALFPRADFTRSAGPSRARTPLMDGRAPPRQGEELRRVGGFQRGDRVFHQKFGYGTILAVEDNKLSIEFDKAGNKMVMDAFVAKA